MDLQEFSLKELYDVKIKSTYSMEVKGKTIEPNETIAMFDKIQIGNFQEIKSHVNARGGYLNEPRVIWDNAKEIQIEFIQGVFSETQFALSSNCGLAENSENMELILSKREELETDETGTIQLKFIPNCDVYLYFINGTKISREEEHEMSEIYWHWNGDNTITLKNSDDIAYKKIIIDYCFSYDNGATSVISGKNFTKGFLYLEGRTRVMDDETGLVRTGIIRIPKLKLMSDLSIRLGAKANPQVSRFQAVAYPYGSQGNKKIMELIFLNDDIDSDI